MIPPYVQTYLLVGAALGALTVARSSAVTPAGFLIIMGLWPVFIAVGIIDGLFGNKGADDAPSKEQDDGKEK